jgi:hypothetical protein
MKSAIEQLSESGKGLREAVPAHQSNRATLLFDQNEAAAFLHVEPRTLESWRQRRVGPRFIRYSQRCVRYRIEDLTQWLEGQIVETASDTGRNG